MASKNRKSLYGKAFNILAIIGALCVLLMFKSIAAPVAGVFASGTKKETLTNQIVYYAQAGAYLLAAMIFMRLAANAIPSPFIAFALLVMGVLFIHKAWKMFFPPDDIQGGNLKKGKM